MKNLITGSTGVIGRRLVNDHDIAMVRHSVGFRNEIIADLSDPSSLENACKNIDTVFHCAGYSNATSAAKSDLHFKVNYLGTKNLLDAAGRAGVKKFIFLSSVKAMADPGYFCVDEDFPGDPSTSYGQSKRQAEEAVLEAGEKFGMHVVNLRLAMVYGGGGNSNLERMARALRAGWFPILPEVHNRRSLLYVDDALSAIRHVVDLPEANGQTYIVADSQAYSTYELCEAILTIAPSPLFNWSISRRMLDIVGRSGDWVSEILKRPFALNSEIIKKFFSSECYSPNKIRHELGWSAQTHLHAGLEAIFSAK